MAKHGDRTASGKAKKASSASCGSPCQREIAADGEQGDGIAPILGGPQRLLIEGLRVKLPPDALQHRQVADLRRLAGKHLCRPRTRVGRAAKLIEQTDLVEAQFHAAIGRELVELRKAFQHLFGLAERPVEIDLRDHQRCRRRGLRQTVADEGKRIFQLARLGQHPRVDDDTGGVRRTDLQQALGCRFGIRIAVLEELVETLDCNPMSDADRGRAARSRRRRIWSI